MKIFKLIFSETMVAESMKCSCCREEECVWELFEEETIHEVETSTSCESAMFYGRLDFSFQAMRQKAYLFFKIFYEEEKGKQMDDIPKCVRQGVEMHYPSNNESGLGALSS